MFLRKSLTGTRASLRPPFVCTQRYWMPLLGSSATAAGSAREESLVICSKSHLDVFLASQCPRGSSHIKTIPTYPLCEHGNIVFFCPALVSCESYILRIEPSPEFRQSPSSMRNPPDGDIVATTLGLYTLQQYSLVAAISFQIQLQSFLLDFLLEKLQCRSELHSALLKMPS